MQIDRNTVRVHFDAYVAKYDDSDDKIRLKKEHTYQVCDLCDSIAQNIGLSKEDTDLAWLLGMLHDVGRFEQIRRFGTFNDAESVDHAKLGADILFRDHHIRDYVLDETEDELIEHSIRAHNALCLPEDLSERERMFCNLLRDADKIDILRVNTEFSIAEIYNVDERKLKEAFITDEVLEQFFEEHAILRSLKKSPIDHLVGHISMIFELVYPISVQILKERGFLKKIFEFKSDNLVTQAQFAQMRMKMEKCGYL